MNGRIDRIRNCVLALLTNPRLRDEWLGALRRSPECRPFALLVESPPVTVVTSRDLAGLVHVGERALRRHVMNVIRFTLTSLSRLTLRS